MADTPTDITGTAIRRVRKADYVVVNIRKLFPGAPPTILGLSEKLQISSDTILNSLLGNAANAHIVPKLHAAEIGGSFPGLGKARTQLKVAAHRFTATGSGRNIHATDKPYLGWGVDTDRPVVLPISKGFRDLMTVATERRQREARVRAVTPNFDALKKQVADLELATTRLNQTLADFDRLTEPNTAEVALLEALDGLFGLVLERPKSPLDADDRSDLVALRRRLDRLRTQARQDLLLSPPDSTVGGAFTRRKTQSEAVLQALRNESFKSNVKVLTDNSDVAPAALLFDVGSAVMYAYRTLLLTPVANDAERDVRAALDLLASKSFDTSGLTSTSNPAFNAAVSQAPAPPAADSALLMLVKLLVGSGPVTVGNMPGPAEVCAGVVEMSGMLILPSVMRDPVNAGTMGARLYRALVVSAGLDGSQHLAQRVELLQAVQSGDLSKIRKISWASRFMTSQGWVRGIAAANLLALYFAVTTDDVNTLRKWVSISGSAAGSSLAVAMLSFGRYGSLVSRGIISGTAASALGVVGALAAVVTGAMTVREELAAGDETGAWVAGVGAAGGVLSVAGFLVAAGAASSATVVGAPLGTVLMVAGAVLVVGSGVVAAVRGFLTSGTQQVWLAALEHLNRAGGPIARVATERPALRAAMDDVLGQRESADFAAVALRNSNDLQHLGFTVEQIRVIVDESEGVVRAQLATGSRP